MLWRNRPFFFPLNVSGIKFGRTGHFPTVRAWRCFEWSGKVVDPGRIDGSPGCGSAAVGLSSVQKNPPVVAVWVSSWSLTGSSYWDWYWEHWSRVTSLSFPVLRAGCATCRQSAVSGFLWVKIKQKRTGWFLKMKINCVQSSFLFPFGETAEKKRKNAVLIHPESRRTKPSRAEPPAAFLPDF